MKKNLLLLIAICVSLLSFSQTNYYSKSTGDLELLTTWGLNTDGSGANPANFTSASTFFNITNRATATVGAAWNVSSASSRIVVGDGVTPCEFIIPAAFVVSGRVNTSSTGTLTIQNTTPPTMSTLNSSSTVVYDGSGAQTIAIGTYGNLTIQNDRGGANITLAAGTISALGTVTYAATSAVIVNTGNTFRYNSPGGGQTIATGIQYNNLLSGSGAGTNTVDGDLNVNGTLTLASGSSLDLGTSLLATATTLTFGNASSNLQTQNLSATAIPSGLLVTGTGVVNYNAPTGGQTIVPIPAYARLTLGNTSGTTTAGGDLVINNALVTTAGATLDMGTNKMSGTLTAITNAGTIQTQNAASDPLPTGKTWSGAGTIEYNGSGAQTIVAGTYTCNLALSGAHGGATITLESGNINEAANFFVTATGIGSYANAGNTFTYTTNGSNTIGGITYNNLSFTNTSGTNTPEANITVDGALSIANGGILDMSTFTLDGALTSVTLNGSIYTSSINNPALPTGKDWSGGTTGLVRFTSLTGAQFIPGGTYKTLACLNTSGTNTVVGGDITMAGVITTSAAGGTLDMGANALSSSSTITNTGTILTQNTTAAPLPTGKTWVGTVEYNGSGSQTLVAGTFTTLALSGAHGGGTITLENGSINVSGDFNVTATGIGSYATGTNTFTYTTNGSNTVGGITYNNLSFTNTSGTNTASGNITVNGALSIANNGTLDMSTFTLDGAMTSVALNGTLNTESTNNPAIPQGKNWTGTTGLVRFANTAGGQFISTGTYKTLTCQNTSGTNTVVGGDLTMTSVLTTSAAGGTLDMGTNTLISAANITNTGTILTQNITATPLPTGKTWAGTVNYNAATGSQTIMTGTYSTLILDNTSGTNTAAGNISVSTALTISNPGTTLDMSTFALGGGLTTITNNGTISTDNISTAPITTGKTFGGTGTVRYNVATGGQTIMAGTYNNLTLLNTSSTNNASNDITVNGTLTTTAGGTFSFPNAAYQLLGATMTVSNSGTIHTLCNVNPAIPAGKTWGGDIIFALTTGGQEIPDGIYNNLTFSNTSGTNTAVGDLQIDGSLTTTSSGTLTMGTNQMTGALTSVTHEGTIITNSTANPAIPSGKDWSGSGGISAVNFTATTGGQFIPSGTYKTLSCSNTSNTNTVVGGDITLTGAITTSGNGGTLDMGTNLLIGATTITNTGTILTQNTSAAPLPSGKTWAGTVNYNAATGGQTIVIGTYTRLTMDNTSSTNTAEGDLTVNTSLTITNPGSTLDMSTFALGGTLSAIANNGLITTDNISATPFTSGKNWGGTGAVRYNVATGGQTIMSGTYNDLTLMNSSGINTASNDITVNGTLTTTAGGTFDFDNIGYQLLGASMTANNNGTIQTMCNVNPAIPAGKTWGGTIIYYLATGAQEIPAGTYNNVTFSNTSGSNTAVGDLQIDGALVTTDGGTLVMGTNQMTGTLTSVTHNGTLTTTNTASPALPSGKDWSGTGGTSQVTFALSSGNQFLPGGTFKTLVCSNTSNTNTATGDITVNNAFTTTSGTNAILDMGTNQLLGAFTPTNSGTILTQNSSSNPIPSGLTWGGTIQYNGTGAQTMVTGTFTNMELAGARIGAPVITLENGSIDVSGNFYMSATGVGSFATGTNVFTYTTNTSRTVGGITYNDLVFTNTSSTKVADGNVTVNGTLTTTTGTGIFDLASFALFNGGAMSVVNNGRISSNGTNNPAIPAGLDWSGTTGLVIFARSNGGQFIPAGTYKTLTCQNTSGTNTAVGTIDVSGTLTTAGSGGTLDMGTNTFTANAITNTNGTIRTQSLSATPIPSGKTIAGVVIYDAATGGQTIVNETGYLNLTLENTSGTNTAAGNIVVNGTITTGGSGTILDMTTFTLGGNGAFTPAGGGTIQTANTSGAPIKTAKTWTQTVEYNSPTGGQSIMNGSYDGGLTNSNTSGTNTAAAASAITVNGDLTLSAGSVLADNNRIITVNGNLVGTGTHNVSASGNITMTGAGGTIDAATLGNLVLNNASGFSLSGSPTINGTLTLTSGLLTIGSNNLTLGTTAPAIAGSPSSSNMIIATGTGEVRKNYSGTGSYTFPIGDNTPNYTPVDINITGGTAGGSAYAGVNVTASKHPNNVNTVDFLNRYWSVTVSGFTSPVYSLTATYVPTDVDGTETAIAAGQFTGALPWIKFGVVNDISHFMSATALSSTQSDFSGITATSSSVSVLPTNPTICSGGTVAIDATPLGDAPFSYSWAPSTDLSTTTGASVIASPTTGGASTTVVYTVTMTDGNGFTSTATSTVSVNPATAAITGTTSVCEGSTTTLSDADAGGTWISSNPAVATIGSATGVVTGVDQGTTTITYFITAGCFVTTTVTVNNAPGPITGTAEVCIGLTTDLDNIEPGGNWTSNDAGIADAEWVNGIITGMAAGVTDITYTLAGGCFATVDATVNPSPSDIAGAAIVCGGFDITLSNADGGGNWSSGSPAVATVGAGTGVVSGIANGNAEISYTFIATGCFVTKTVTVTNVPGAITGTASVCIGATTALGNAETGGEWTSSVPANATIGATDGIVSGIAAGNADITYTISPGCFATQEVTVDPLPNAGTITGTANINVSSSFAFSSNGTGGGTWTASNANATVSPVGLVTGVSGGMVTISYSVTDGCGTAVATYDVSINSMSMDITGYPQTCVGYTTQLSHAYTGGTWSSSNTAKATVGSLDGIVTGVEYGVLTITYTADGSYVTVDVLVNSYPPPILGSSNVCEGLTTTLTHTEAGGVWESSNPAVATIDGSGLVTGISTGSSTITYTVNSTCHITKAVGVYPIPDAIAGTLAVCEGGTSTLTNSTPIGESWVSSNTSVATIGLTSGVVSGVASGTTTITYTTNVGCSNTTEVTVTAAPSISGTYVLCATTTTMLTPSTGGGTWSSSNTSVATIDGTSGIVSGIAGGTSRISYILGSGCVTTQVISVNHMPSPITGTTLVCVGNTVTLSSATPGCLWTSSSPAIATIGSSSHIVTGISAGTAQISYTHPLGCMRTTYVTVDPVVDVITGTNSVCSGLTTTLSNATSGGAWSGSNPTIATITSGGIVTGAAAGTINVSYTVSVGCKVGTVVSVFALPDANAGTTDACVTFTSALTDGTPGGAWSSSNAAIASVDAGTGIVTAVAGGTATITYTTTEGCIKTVMFTANELPTDITGVNFACIGSSCTLFCASGGGLSWTSSNTGIATIGSISGEVTGVSAGIATMTYLTTTGCSTTRDVTINAAPSGGTISGPNTVIIGNTITLNDEFTYGSWTSSDAGIASIAEATISSATVTGVSAGIATMTYTVDNGCGLGFSTYDVSVTVSRPGIGSNGGTTVTMSSGKDISLYPNPTSGTFTLTAPEAGAFYIYTIDGKEVAQYEIAERGSSMEMPEHLASGMYTCRFVGNSGSIVMVRLVYEP